MDKVIWLPFMILIQWPEMVDLNEEKTLAEKEKYLHKYFQKILEYLFNQVQQFLLKYDHVHRYWLQSWPLHNAGIIYRPWCDCCRSASRKPCPSLQQYRLGPSAHCYNINKHQQRQKHFWFTEVKNLEEIHLFSCSIDYVFSFPLSFTKISFKKF